MSIAELQAALLIDRLRELKAAHDESKAFIENVNESEDLLMAFLEEGRCTMDSQSHRLVSTGIQPTSRACIGLTPQ